MKRQAGWTISRRRNNGGSLASFGASFFFPRLACFACPFAPDSLLVRLVICTLAAFARRLFCWLFARRNGGQFILRIDDTDQQRNVQEALAPILHGLRWLGIDWDEGPEVGGPHAPYYQSQRAERHQAAVEKLLASGAAYRDYATPEELEAERNAAQAEKRPFLYSRRFWPTPPPPRPVSRPRAAAPWCD